MLSPFAVSAGFPFVTVGKWALPGVVLFVLVEFAELTGTWLRKRVGVPESHTIVLTFEYSQP